MKIAIAGGVFAFLALGFLLEPKLALAQEEIGTDYHAMQQRHQTGTKQMWALEFRFGAYRPNVDDDPALRGGPYNTIFGTPQHFLIGTELDWQAIRIPFVGSLGPGLQLNYVSISRAAAWKYPRTVPPNSSENTSLAILPVYALAVLRVDAFWRSHRFPLIPYAKAGLGAARWWSSTDAGTTNINGVPAKGTSYGYLLAAGLQFNLNILDEYTAKNADNSLGLNSTSIFFEVYTSDLSSFRSSSALWVGDTTWVAGLTFEF